MSYRIGIIGATGYTGSELVRILSGHNQVEISLITSESRAGDKFSDVHPFFQGIADQQLFSVNQISEFSDKLDLVFLALPHGVSMEFVRQYHQLGFKIIDLSGDFRLNSAQSYQDWYRAEHTFPAGIDQAVFGLPELFADQIKTASLIANPGCFPTGSILAVAPLLNTFPDLFETVIIDSKSGTTGAGVKAKTGNMFCNVNDNFKAYGITSHRHTVEIEQIINRIARKTEQKLTVQFTPHLLPVDRGILSTIYLKPEQKNQPADINQEKLTELFQIFYQNAPFIRIRQQPPALKDVRGTNYCDLFPVYDSRTGMIIIISVIDNLVRGASGQAVQNMNLMLGIDQTCGLKQIPLCP